MSPNQFLLAATKAQYGRSRIPAEDFLIEHLDFLIGLDLPAITNILKDLGNKRIFPTPALEHICTLVATIKVKPGPKPKKENPPSEIKTTSKEKEKEEEQKTETISEIRIPAPEKKAVATIYGFGYQVAWTESVSRIDSNGKKKTIHQKMKETYASREQAYKRQEDLYLLGIAEVELGQEVLASQKFATQYEAEAWTLRRLSEATFSLRATVYDPVLHWHQIINRPEAVARSYVRKKNPATKTQVKFSGRLGNAMRTHQTRASFSRG